MYRKPERHLEPTTPTTCEKGPLVHTLDLCPFTRRTPGDHWASSAISSKAFWICSKRPVKRPWRAMIVSDDLKMTQEAL